MFKRYRIVKNTNGYYIIQKKGLFGWNTLGRHLLNTFIPMEYYTFDEAETEVMRLINKPKEDIVIKEYNVTN